MKLNIKTGFTLLALALFVIGVKLISPLLIAGGMAMAIAPPVVKIDKSGLTGDTLVLVESIEKRMSITPETQDKGIIADEVRAAMGAQFKDISPEQITELLGNSDKGLRAIMKVMGEKITSLTESARKAPEDMSVRAQVARWNEDNKVAIAAIKTGERASLKPLEIRVASPMTPANTLNGSAYLPTPQFEAGYNDIVRVSPTFWDYIKKGVSSSAVYVWVNKINPLGNAAFIGPGVAKPGISFELATQTSNAKKIAESLKCATELLSDIDGMASFINDELRYAIDAKTNTSLMTSASSNTAPAGIQTLSVAYSLVGVETANPNNWDAVVAAVAQLRHGNLQGRVVAFVNPVDYANMRLTKAVNQGQLFVPAQSGAEIVEDNNVAIGYVQVALIDYYRILIYEDFKVTMGWENDDFTKNLVTFVGERRLHQMFSTNYTGAFIYDTFANIKSAIASA